MADLVSTQAIGALEAAVAALLPVPVPNGLTRRLRVLPSRIRPLGLGGYLGQHVDPAAPITGRRIQARVELSVDGGNDSTAAGYAATLTGQILAQTRAEFAARGIHRIQGLSTEVARDLAFDVDFEFIRLPEGSEGLIETLALDSFVNLTPYRTRRRFEFAAAALATEAAPLAQFQPLDDPAAAPAGAWSLDATVPAALRQSATSAGGALTLADPVKAGTMLLLRPGGAPLALARFVLQVDFSATGPDGIGLVFDHRAADDYAYVLLSQRHGYHLLGRRRPGGFTTLASAAAGFSPGSALQRLRLVTHDRALHIELDERRTLSAVLDAPLAGGELGLLTHANASARFAAGGVWELV